MANIPDEQMKALQREFMGIDVDGNGEVSIEELGTLLRSMRVKLRVSESQIKRALKQIDINGDGTIDSDEMMEVLEKYDTD